MAKKKTTKSVKKSSPKLVAKKLSAKEKPKVIAKAVKKAAPSADVQVSSRPKKTSVEPEKPMQIEAVNKKQGRQSSSSKEDGSSKAEKNAVLATDMKWSEVYEKYKAEKAQIYDMKAQFESNRPIQHKVLGWGWVISNENDRLEVLFKDGKRMLISNYQVK